MYTPYRKKSIRSRTVNVYVGYQPFSGITNKRARIKIKRSTCYLWCAGAYPLMTLTFLEYLYSRSIHLPWKGTSHVYIYMQYFFNSVFFLY